jgi:pyruvyl transferase EpsO
VPGELATFLQPSGDLFLAALLIPAMAVGEELAVEGPVSPSLLRNLEAARDLLVSWNPRNPWCRLAPVALRAPLLQEVAGGGACGLFFTGGVDSFFSIHDPDGNLGASSVLVFAEGFDVPLASGPLRSRIKERLREAARLMGKAFIPVATNYRALTDPLIPWEMAHGGGLASSGLAVGGAVRRIGINSSDAYISRTPYGTHPDLDVLWSRRSLEFVPVGTPYPRSRKLATLVGDPVARSFLRVCWENIGGRYNCRQCEKCLRTMLQLDAMGALDDFPTLAGEIPERLLDRLREPAHRLFLWEELASVLGGDPAKAALVYAIGRMIERSRAGWSGPGAPAAPRRGWPGMRRSVRRAVPWLRLPARAGPAGWGGTRGDRARAGRAAPDGSPTSIRGRSGRLDTMPSASGSAFIPDDLAGRLRRTLDEELTAALAGQPAAALAIFPNHWNIGDSAIWLGQLATLERLRVELRYVCDWRTYRRDDLRRRLPEGPILLSGGGNFGDVYANEQGLRERILDDFADRPIIQLPQSLWFRSGAKLDEMRRRCERNRRFMLLVRDLPSLSLTRERLAISARLAPDMAFGLPDLRGRRSAADVDVLWLLRRDIEASDRTARTGAASGPSEAVRDWTRPGRAVVSATLAKCVRACWLSWRLARSRGGPFGYREAQVGDTFARLAELRLAIGLRLLSTGRVVVTDRLHGHILALLMGIPNVCLDNRNGKVRALCESWTAGHPLTGWAESVAAARESARELLGRRDGSAESRASDAPRA